MKKVVLSLVPLVLLYLVLETALSTVDSVPFATAPKTTLPTAASSMVSPWGETRVVQERIFLGVPTVFEMPHRFRAFLPPHEKKEGVKRIVFIGDSFMFGAGVAEHETLPFGMSAYLRHLKPELAVEIVNLGIPGADTQTYLQLCEIAKSYQPDLVILGFTIGNDADIDPQAVLDLPRPPENLTHASVKASPESKVRTTLKTLRNLLFSHSRTLSALYRPLRKFEARSRQDAYMRLTYGENWENVSRNLKAFGKFHNDLRVPVILLVYPHMFSSTGLGLNSIQNYLYGDYHRRVSDLADSIGFTVVDVLDFFRLESIDSLDDYLVVGDGHPNGAFNALVARHLAMELPSSLIQFDPKPEHAHAH